MPYGRLDLVHHSHREVGVRQPRLAFTSTITVAPLTVPARPTGHPLPADAVRPVRVPP
ncbi:hypothetical protein AB0D11_10815 [Streptomyces monashensis]|uniref:hypothetical protein n=1 Tax=Streptomyces monashensis TaxID=1678012 RepID=UPI0033EF3BF1